jgi:hypothetical protein
LRLGELSEEPESRDAAVLPPRGAAGAFREYPVPCRAVPGRTGPCHAVQCRAVPCRAVPYRAAPCCAVSGQGMAATASITTWRMPYGAGGGRMQQPWQPCRKLRASPEAGRSVSARPACRPLRLSWPLPAGGTLHGRGGGPLPASPLLVRPQTLIYRTSPARRQISAQHQALITCRRA